MDAWHTGAEWLRATHATAYPDFVPQISVLFDSSRSGDIVAFAAAGWALERDEIGHHGSARKEDMLAQMLFAGPGLPKGAKLPYARLVDLTPTLLGMLGVDVGGEGMDGEDLGERLRRAHWKSAAPG